MNDYTNDNDHDGQVECARDTKSHQKIFAKFLLEFYEKAWYHFDTETCRDRAVQI